MGYIPNPGNFKALFELAAKPTAQVDTGFLYTKDAGGVTQLFFEDESGNETQLTGAGSGITGSGANTRLATWSGASTLTSSASLTWTATAGLTTSLADAATNSVSTGLTLGHTTSGTAAAGFGTSILFTGVDAAGNAENMASIQADWTDATNTSEDSEIVFATRTAGAALATVALIDGVSGIRSAFAGSATKPGVGFSTSATGMRDNGGNLEFIVAGARTMQISSGGVVTSIVLSFNGITMVDATNLILQTTTGTKVGTATTQKLGFWNATPVVQPASTGTTTAGFTANASANTVFAESTFTGNTGATAYTISDVVRNLKTAGLLAA